MRLEWVYYITLIACVLQVVSFLFAYFRTEQWNNLWLGVPAFLLIGAGCAMLEISIGDAPRVPREGLVMPIRWCFLVGSVLWIAEQMVYVHNFLRIVRK